MPNPRRVDQEIQRLVSEIDRLELQATRQTIDAVNDLRRRIILALVEEDELTITTRDIIRERFNLILQEFENNLITDITENQRRLFVRGILIVDRSLEAGGLLTGLPHLSEQTLEQLRQFSADLVTNITDDVRNRLRQEIDLAVLGQKPISEVVKDIGRNLDDPSIFRSVAKRAEVITETEVKRVQRMATEERLEQAKERFPEMKKMWNHSHQGVPRPGHLELDGEVVGADEKFVLIGQDGIKYEVAGPFDPILPAGEVVNCKCYVTPILEDVVQ